MISLEIVIGSAYFSKVSPDYSSTNLRNPARGIPLFIGTFSVSLLFLFVYCWDSVRLYLYWEHS
jgi:hypothetical protein